MNETKKKYNKEFAKVKKEIFDRDAWECMMEESHRCKGQLDVHHIISRSLMGSNDKTNLITVCRYYHGKLHLIGIRGRVKKCREVLKDRYDYTYKDEFTG